MRYIIDIPDKLVIKSALKGQILGICLTESITQQEFVIPTNIPLHPYIEPRNGKWIKGDDCVSEYSYFCNQCKAHHRARYDYCPSCGSKMD